MHAVKTALEVLLVWACIPCVALGVDEGKPYGRFCVCIEDASGGETPFARASGGTPGSTVIVHTDANQQCSVLVVAFNGKDGSLTNGWRPQFAELEQWEEHQLPNPPVTWRWTKPAGPFEFWVLFFAPNFDEARDIEKLVSTMDDSKAAGNILKLQTSKLHELIGQAMAGQGSQFAAVAPADVGGVMRDGEFHWRQFASSVNFSPQTPGIRILAGAAAK